MLACYVFGGQIIFGVRHVFQFQMNLGEKVIFYNKLKTGLLQRGFQHALQLKTVIRSRKLAYHLFLFALQPFKTFYCNASTFKYIYFFFKQGCKSLKSTK